VQKIANITRDLELIRENLVGKYQEKLNLMDEEIYYLSRQMDLKIMEFME